MSKVFQVVFLVAGSLLAVSSAAALEQTEPSDTERRSKIQQRAQQLFGSAENDCRAFAELAGYAADLAPSVADWLEDLRLVLIGADWGRREGDRGALFHGVHTADRGFKPQFRDGSSQVEHGFAAIYLGRTLPPGSAVIAGGLKEIKDAFVRSSSVSDADMTLWAVGGQLGEQLNGSNLTRVAGSIVDSMCAAE